MTFWWRCALAQAIRVSLWLLPGAFGTAAFAVLGWAAWWVSSLSDFRNTTPFTLVTLLLLGVVVVQVSRYRSTRPTPAASDVELAPDVHPDLWAVVRSAARGVGAAAPDRVHLGPDPTQPVVARSRWVRGRRRVVLVVGVAPLCVLTSREWQATVARTLAAGRIGSRLERRTVRGQLRVEALEVAARGSRLLGRLHTGPCRAHAWLAGPVCRRLDLDADVAGAAGATLEDARLALLRVPAAQLVWDRFWRWHVLPATGLLRRPVDVVGGFRRYVEAVGVPELSPTSPELAGATYPFLSVEARAAALSGRASEAGTTAGATAHPDQAVDLLGDQARTLTNLELAWFEGSGLTPLEWDPLAHATASRGVRERAAWFLDAVSTPGSRSDLTRVLDDLENAGGRHLRGSLFGPSEHDAASADPDDDPVLADLVGDLIACALVETTGAQFVTTWGLPATLVASDGSSLDPWASALDAVREPDLVDGLRRWCGERGVPRGFRAVPPGPHLGRTSMDSDPVVLASACVVNNVRTRYLFLLDSGLVVMRPRWSDHLLGGLAQFAGEIGSVMHQRWARASGTTVMESRRSAFTAWADVRAARSTTRSAGRFSWELALVDGSTIRLKGDARSHVDGDLRALLRQLLGDRLDEGSGAATDSQQVSPGT